MVIYFFNAKPSLPICATQIQSGRSITTYQVAGMAKNYLVIPIMRFKTIAHAILIYGC
jgi:hypothetical protein